jgi:zinc protease
VVTNINAGVVRGLEQVGGFSGKAAQLAEGLLYADDPLFINQYLEWINSATVQDVRDAARTWLNDGWHQVNVVPAAAYTSSASGVDRSGGLPAIPDDIPALTFPAIETAQLGNGIDVVLAERHAVPLVTLSIQFDAGYAADAGAKPGVASFVMAMLDKGTTSRSAPEIADEAERLGAILVPGANNDASFVNLSALTDKLGDSIALWADLLINPAFEEAELERLRTQRITAIAQEKAQPESLAQRLLNPLLYGAGHPYGVPASGTGTVASTASITQADLRAFRATWLRPDNARIFVVGDTTLDEIVPVLERALRRWTVPAGTPAPTKNISTVGLPAAPRVILVDKPGSPQSMILAGHLLPGLGTAQDLALEAMNDVLGGTFTARVNMNLREEKGWSYGAQTQLQNARGQRPFIVRAPVQTDRTGDSLAELLRELTTIQDSRPVTQPEMDRVIAGSTRELSGQFETSQAVLNSLVTSARYGRPLDYAATLTDSYAALARTDLQNAANGLIKPHSLVWIIIGDLAQIRPQVEALNIAPVEIFNDEGEPVR